MAGENLSRHSVRLRDRNLALASTFSVACQDAMLTRTTSVNILWTPVELSWIGQDSRVVKRLLSGDDEKSIQTDARLYTHSLSVTEAI